MRTVYLDYNATTPIAPSVLEAMTPFFLEHYGNPSSDHFMGRAAHYAVEEARERVAHALGAEPQEIVFTSSGTEANNLALQGLVCRHDAQNHAHLVISAIEHPAVAETARALQKLGYGVTICPCNDQGVVSPEAIRDALQERTVLVSVMHANNETGAIQPIREIAAICRARGIALHSDAAQSFGKINTHVGMLGVDMLSVAGHKFYAPKGIGALYIKRTTPLNPIQHGGAHEFGLRPGTENVPYIVGLGKAAELASRALDENQHRLADLRARLLIALRSQIPDLVVHAEGAPRIPNTLSVAFPDVDGRELLGRAPEICASTGAACHSHDGPMSATLLAMGTSHALARGTIRLSLGWPTSVEEVDFATERLIAAWEAR